MLKKTKLANSYLKSLSNLLIASLFCLQAPGSFAAETQVKPISSEEYLVEQVYGETAKWDLENPGENNLAFDSSQNSERTLIYGARQISESEPNKSSELTSAVDRSEKSNYRRPRVALVLGGGGLRGAAHVGVLRVLERERIPIDMVIGTSMGAIIGGLYCSGVPTEKLENKIVHSFVSTFFDAPLLVQALKINTGLLFFRKPDGLYNGSNLARCIERHIPEDKREISSFHPQFGAVTTDLVTGKTVVLTKGDLAKALQATSAVPGFRGPVAMDDSVLVDGGITCNLPVEQARQLGADFVIAVDVDEKIEVTTAKSFHRNLGKIGSRVLALMLAKIDESQKAQANFSIQPNVTGIALLSKKISDGNRALAAGESAAESALPELRLKLMLAGVDLDLPHSDGRQELAVGKKFSNSSCSMVCPLAQGIEREIEN